MHSFGFNFKDLVSVERLLQLSVKPELFLVYLILTYFHVKTTALAAFFFHSLKKIDLHVVKGERDRLWGFCGRVFIIVL